MNEFKPGDVVVHPKHGRGLVQDSIVEWAAGGDYSILHRVAADLRRLVVIDPEDREQVERLHTLWCEAIVSKGTSAARQIDSMQAALREFANPKPPKPPKPEEPTGLGAVVEDASGQQWVRCRPDGGAARWRRAAPLDHPDADPWSVWSALDAVRVLSEGVQP